MTPLPNPRSPATELPRFVDVEAALDAALDAALAAEVDEPPDDEVLLAVNEDRAVLPEAAAPVLEALAEAALEAG